VLCGAKVEVWGDVMLVYCRGALRRNWAGNAKGLNRPLSLSFGVCISFILSSDFH